MRLVSLVKSQKISDRWYAEFENGDRISVDTALIADFSLFSGRELSGEEFAALKAAAETARIRARALRSLSYRAMSRREIKTRLLEKGESEEAAEDTVCWLERRGLVNDAEYAASIARHYAAKGYGMGKIKDELYRRGVPREYWDEAAESIPDDAGDAIDALLERRLKGSSDKKELKRASDMLARRGFSWDEIRSALNRYTENLEETDE